MYRGGLAIAGSMTLIFGIFVLWQFVHPTAEPYTLAPLPTPRPTTQVATLPQRAGDTPQSTTTSIMPVLGPTAPQRYFEINTGCLITLDDTCVTAMSRPDASSTPRTPLRMHSVLHIKSSTTSSDGTLWYEIDFPEALRYADRLTLPWFIPSTVGNVITMEGPQDLGTSTPTTSKRMIVDRSDQLLIRYDGDTLVATHTISTGRELTPTPRGTFTIFRKTPSRYMQGPIPGISTNYYDLPGVPFNLYFTKQGAVVHGAYWHNRFGRPYSNGCVNLPPAIARTVYEWAPLGTTVTVRD